MKHIQHTMTGNGNHVTPLLFGKIREMTLGKFNLLLDGYKPFVTTVRQRGRGGGCVGIIPSVVKKKAVAKARLWPCTQMPSFLAVPSLRRQKASMTTTKYFP